jgi:CO/xanthine dehydrogenase Mo-binding subunit
MQANGIIEGIVTKAAKQLGIDQVAIRRINAPEGKALYGPPTPEGRRRHVTGAFVKDALDRGAALFDWQARSARSGQQRGTKKRGLGVAVGPHGAGSIGFDGLMILRPDGRLQVQTGVGNLGTHSLIDLARVAADVLAMPWEKVEIVWGNTAKGLPWSCMSVGSQTTHAMTRAAHAAGMDARRKLQQIAALTLGGRPEDYEIAEERVLRRGGGRGLSLAQAAQRAIELGGTYDGHELPSDINPFTKASATALAGQGLMGVARDSYGRDGASKSSVAGFAEVEVDIETGSYRVLDFVAVADVGTVIHPRNLGGQICGGILLGLGHAIGQKWAYDKRYGTPLARRFYQTKPPTILDTPLTMQWAALDIPDPETPVGARGVGEAPVGAGFGAVVNALAAAIGDDLFRRAPVTADMILTALEAGRPTHDPLTANV